MSVLTKGWTLADFAAAYVAGHTVVDVIESVLSDLDGAPVGVLIGPPLHQSARADAKRLGGIQPTSLPLYGVPFLVKDNIDVEGADTTAACPGAARTATADATVVALLRAAGAVPVGKSNLDQFATGLVGTRSPYGTPPNVLDPALVPGGSSSGSAVGVALGLVPFSVGTDTAGSGRVPAALNGIVGVKPTVGSMSTIGVLPAVRRFDCPSVFARCVADAALVAGIMTGHDPLDPFSRHSPSRRPFRSSPVVGVPAAWPSSIALDPAIVRSFDQAVEDLRRLGMKPTPVDIGALIDVGSILYGSATVAERTASVGRFVADDVEGLDSSVAHIIGSGAALSAVEAYLAEYELVRLRSAASAMWQDIDVLALPTVARVPTLAEVASDPFGPNEQLGVFTTFANLLDLACIVVPSGLQLIAPAWQDDELVRVALGLEHGALQPAEQPCTIVVVGAHLQGQPLNHQLVDRRASLVERTTTTAHYRLYALADTTPPKPGLVRVDHAGGEAIEVEVWSMGASEFGTFVQGVPPPLCIGTITTADGSSHKGFLCEPEGLTGAVDITHHRGWRNYLQS